MITRMSSEQFEEILNTMKELIRPLKNGLCPWCLCKPYTKQCPECRARNILDREGVL